jgi:membrane peptidoglycan carboxypeptidase
MITEQQLDRFQGRSMARLLKPSDLTRGCGVSKVPFFCEYVQLAFLDDPAYGKTRADRRALLNSGGLTIRTTLDLDDQKSAQNAVETYLPTGDPSERVAAIAMVEPGTGNVRAMAQNLKYGKGEDASFINNAVDAKYSGTNGQQPGSTFKIFTVAAAIEQGLPMNESIYSPDSITMPYGSYEDCEANTVGEWTTGNYDGAAPGSYTMYTGTAKSINTYFAQLAERAGLCNVWDAASRAGVTDARTGQDPLDNAEEFQMFGGGIIGGGALSMSPLTLAESYATFAARGLHCESRVITAVRSLDGSQLRVPKPDCEQVFEPEVADAVTDVMVSVVSEGGTGVDMYLDRPTAGKTGTTDNHTAVWFAGYTPDLAAAVWTGHPDAPQDNPMEYVTINGTYYYTVSGYQLPGPIWEAAMRGALADVPPSSFTPMDPSFIDGDTLTVPSLSGLTEKAAVAKLESLGLNPEVADYTVASYSAAGTVSYTSPGTGYEVSPGTTVTIYLSSGTPPTPTATPTPSKSDKPSPSPSPSESGGSGNANPDSNPNPGNGGDNGNAGGNGNN